MPKKIASVAAFTEMVKRKDITGVTIKKNADSVKYKLRGGKYLYTFVLNDVSRAAKIRKHLPEGWKIHDI
ncbi:putative large subunit ribosomal protein L38e [Paratrimastix pyriformis]|uniref:Large subunit ribosomal protein L38e n=1 Tax=Paratrimastix pyriformis TaxID=342808 RepID=A0ABQ8UC90_9EUKA|nr:putative large subunit ribosomal protein L38e [Paratrimastix pyriformis]